MKDNVELFRSIENYAYENTTCNKIPVGSYVKLQDGLEVYSCNSSETYNCKKHNECFKYKVTGIYKSCEETRKYCKAIHSEVNMINKLINLGYSNGDNITLYVSRYPCLNCAKEIVKFGFSKVIYYGLSEISHDVREIFESNNIDIEWIKLESNYE